MVRDYMAKLSKGDQFLYIILQILREKMIITHKGNILERLSQL